jgi:Na+/H+ antiporter NhaC
MQSWAGQFARKHTIFGIIWGQTRDKTRLSPYFDRMKSNRIAGIAALLLGGLLFLSFPALANAPAVVHEVRAWSVVPPLVAIVMALVLREVYLSLLLAVLSGAWILAAEHYGLINGLIIGLLRVIDTYVMKALWDKDHLSVIVFSMLIGGMVALLSRNGGMQGVVHYLTRWAKDARSGQWVTWLLGIVIFFDDYANTLLVGNTMRPVTDRLRISRAKLAYLVDATAAPVASVAFISTWIGAELGYIQGGLDKIGELNLSAYQVFMASVPYSFYAWLTIAFMAMVIYRQRDFGPMLRSERLARQHGVGSSSEAISQEVNAEFEMKEGLSPKAYRAIVPVLTVVVGVVAGLLVTGWDAALWSDASKGLTVKLSGIVGGADSFKSLLYGSFAGCCVALMLSVNPRNLTLNEAMDALLHGFKTMLPATLILVLAWSLASLTEEMHTADYISRALVSLEWSARFLPALAFVMGGLVAFSTGTSWGTMAILYPLLLPAGWEWIGQAGVSPETSLMLFYQLVSAVLAGSVLGDHCSPISDTTIMSSLASSCNHLEHVRTQMPYAMLVGLVSIFVCSIPAAFGVSLWIVYPLSLALFWWVLGRWGKGAEA